VDSAVADTLAPGRWGGFDAETLVHSDRGRGSFLHSGGLDHRVRSLCNAGIGLRRRISRSPLRRPARCPRSAISPLGDGRPGHTSTGAGRARYGRDNHARATTIRPGTRISDVPRMETQGGTARSKSVASPVAIAGLHARHQAAGDRRSKIPTALGSAESLPTRGPPRLLLCIPLWRSMRRLAQKARDRRAEHICAASDRASRSAPGWKDALLGHSRIFGRPIATCAISSTPSSTAFAAR
jgi:hypothetical protein